MTASADSTEDGPVSRGGGDAEEFARYLSRRLEGSEDSLCRPLFLGLLLTDEGRSLRHLVAWFQDRQNSGWVDQLANQSRVRWEVPPGRESLREESATTAQDLARWMGITANRFPCLVVLPLDLAIDDPNLLLVPLDPESFARDESAEPFLRDFFSLVQEAATEARSPLEAHQRLKESLQRERRRRNRGELAARLRKGANIVFIQLPGKIAEGFATGLGRVLGTALGG